MQDSASSGSVPTSEETPAASAVTSPQPADADATPLPPLGADAQSGANSSGSTAPGGCGAGRGVGGCERDVSSRDGAGLGRRDPAGRIQGNLRVAALADRPGSRTGGHQPVERDRIHRELGPDARAPGNRDGRRIGSREHRDGERAPASAARRDRGTGADRPPPRRPRSAPRPRRPRQRAGTTSPMPAPRSNPRHRLSPARRPYRQPTARFRFLPPQPPQTNQPQPPRSSIPVPSPA